MERTIAMETSYFTEVLKSLLIAAAVAIMSAMAYTFWNFTTNQTKFSTIETATHHASRTAASVNDTITFNKTWTEGW